MSLTWKLVVMVLIPIIGLAGFAALEVGRRRSMVADMNDLVKLVDLSVRTSKLIDALERERGFAASMLALDSGAVSFGFSNQKRNTDEQIADFVGTLSQWSGAGSVTEVATTAQEALGTLNGMREGLSSGVASMEIISAYSNVNKELLTIIALSSEAATEALTKSMLLSIEYLARLKVDAGLERAALNMVFSMDFADPGMVRAEAELLARQDVYEALFLSHGHPEDREIFLVAMNQGDHEEFEELRNAVLEGLETDGLGVDPQLWWKASSQRINALAEVSSSVADHTLEIMADQRSDARVAAIISSLLALGAILLAGVLSGTTARELGRNLTSAASSTQETVTQIMSSVQQLSASTAETATAVAQTSTTIDELRQTSVTAAEKAENTSNAAQESKSASDEALKSVSEGMEAMQSIRDGVEAIAGKIVDLSDKTVRIGEIVESVKAIAEQSNLLAVNASIEAAKAGEQGRGFAVVANEVKALAEGSKEAADEIRATLSEIEHSSNAAVMITEQGVKRVGQGSELIGELGHTIDRLARVIEDGADATRQISLTAQQQLSGIEQITDALKSVERATADNAAGAVQLEEAAKDVNVVSGRLTVIIRGVQGAKE